MWFEAARQEGETCVNLVAWETDLVHNCFFFEMVLELMQVFLSFLVFHFCDLHLDILVGRRITWKGIALRVRSRGHMQKPTVNTRTQDAPLFWLKKLI